jgi:hypothetical protein
MRRLDAIRHRTDDRPEHLTLRRRPPPSRHLDTKIDDLVGHRGADELGGDPLERTTGRPLGRLDRRSDTGPSVEEPEGRTQLAASIQAERSRILGRLEVEQVEGGEHAETIPEAG